MNPDRRAGIGPHRNPDRNPVTRVALASLIAVGSFTSVPPLLEKLASWFQITPVAQALTPNCRTGLGVTADNAAFSKGARVIVVEDLNGSRLADQRLRVGEEVLVVFEGPSNTVKGGIDARQFVYFATDTNGRRVSSKLETTVTCGKFEHTSSIVEEEPQRRETPTPSRTATPASTSLPSVSPTPDRVATLEAQLRGINATATRVAENKQLAQEVRTAVATEARATIEAERRATETVTKLIKDAKDEERKAVLATVTAQAGVTPTVAARGGVASPAGTSPIDSIPGWLLGGIAVVAAALGGILIWRRRHPAPAPAAGGGAPGPAGPPVVP